MLNKVMLIGNVGQDPNVRYLDGNNTKVASLRIATTERYRDRNGEIRENTEWHNVTAWRATADYVERLVKKGAQIYVEGKLTTREWTDRDGNKRLTTEVSADTIQLLGRREQNSDQNGGSYQGGGYQGGNRGAYANGGQNNWQGGNQGGYTPQPTPAPAPAPAPAQDFTVADEGNGDDLPF